MKYILFGAGNYMYTHIDEEKIQYFDYIVDRSPDKTGTAYLGKEIRSPEVLLEEDKDNIFVVITAFVQLYSIEYDLIQMGFEKYKHFDWIARLRNHYPEHILWREKSSEKWKRDERRWRERHPNNAPPHERAELVAKMIHWDGVGSVLDLGAGSEPMRPFLPDGVKYYPVDYKQLTGNTLVFDFNKKQFPDIKADVVILIGVHGFVDYEVWLIDQAVKAVNPCGQLLISLNYYTENFHTLDFITKYCDIMKCTDYAFRSKVYGIFNFVKIGG